MSRVVHQFFYTHCTYGSSAIERRSDSLAETVLGYSVRAASLPKHELEQCIRDVESLLSYELPADSTFEQRRLIQPEQAPGRLIFAKTSRGRAIAARISYRSLDVAGRPGSLFAHVLLDDESSRQLSSLQCLKLWQAPGWVIKDSAEIAHDLVPLTSPLDLLESNAPIVGDEAFRAFLSDDHESNRDLVPERWRTRACEDRRDFLISVLAVFLAKENRPVHFLAEPAFAALLMYGLLRLAGLKRDVRDVSISTFEPGGSRKLPTISSQFLYDPSQIGQLLTDVGRYANVIDTFGANGVVNLRSQSVPLDVEAILGCDWDDVIDLLSAARSESVSGLEKDPIVGGGGLPATAEAASMETDAPTSHQKTLSETGNESAGLNCLRPSEVTAGSLLGPYLIVRKLGEGGMGAVFEARHTKLKKTVAVKVLPPKFSQSEMLISRFEREMEAVGTLDHPHIVRAMDAGEFQGTHFLVMEYVEGRDLSVMVKERGPRSVIEACEMIRQAAVGLAHAHHHGLVHRDIKPGNLFATKNSLIKILDLGLALAHGDRQQDSDAGALTTMGQFLGTPDYMAPEQWENSHTADGRADLYALGCTLFFLLTGRAPYADAAHPSLASKMRGHTTEPIPDLRAARCEAVADRPKLINEPLPDEVETLYRRLMAKLPTDRIASAEELAKTLQNLVKSLRPSSAGTKLPVSVIPTAPPPETNRLPKNQSPVDQLIQAIENRNPADFIEHFDVRVIRQHNADLRRWLLPLVAMVDSEIINSGLATPKLPRVTDAVTTERPNELVVRWSWPPARFVDRCILGLAPSRLPESTMPDEVSLVVKSFVTRERYAAAGGILMSGSEITDEGFWVVWSEVNLEFQTLLSPCLCLGNAKLLRDTLQQNPSVVPRKNSWREGLNGILAWFSRSSPHRDEFICPRCCSDQTRFREQRREWICDQCDHRWSTRSKIAPAFISYRREGGSEIARAIRAELMRRNVTTFLDVDDLRSHYYDERLLREIESSKNFILILSPGCLDRCFDPDDWLRKEILHAMKTQRNIVPILTQGFQFPSAVEIVPELRELPRYNCVEYSHAFFQATVQKLFDFMQFS